MLLKYREANPEIVDHRKIAIGMPWWRKMELCFRLNQQSSQP